MTEFDTTAARYTADQDDADNPTAVWSSGELRQACDVIDALRAKLAEAENTARLWCNEERSARERADAAEARIAEDQLRFASLQGKLAVKEMAREGVRSEVAQNVSIDKDGHWKFDPRSAEAKLAEMVERRDYWLAAHEAAMDRVSEVEAKLAKMATDWKANHDDWRDRAHAIDAKLAKYRTALVYIQNAFGSPEDEDSVTTAAREALAGDKEGE